MKAKSSNCSIFAWELLRLSYIDDKTQLITPHLTNISNLCTMIAVIIIRSEKNSCWLQHGQSQINLEKINEKCTFNRSLLWYTNVLSSVKRSMKSFENCKGFSWKDYVLWLVCTRSFLDRTSIQELQVVVYFELDNLQPDRLIFQFIQIYYNSSSISSGTCSFSMAAW